MTEGKIEDRDSPARFTAATQRAVVEAAIAQINNSTNVLLVLRTTETSYIFIQAGAVNTG